MNHKQRMPRAARTIMRNAGHALLAALMLLALPVAGFAQETTSAIRGTISAPDGSPAAGASVRVTDTRTGRSRVASTSASGRFLVGDLAVGGPYTVAISTPNYAPQNITDIYIALGETFEFDLTLSGETIEEITVTAAMVESVQVAVGPSSTFNFDELQNLPSINRDIRDIVRVDPRVYIDEAFVDAVQCVGANPRFNSLTVDGVKLNDNFGLNSNGYPTQRMPFPYDAIQNIALELSPYDVQYGGFTACNINAVTRSGSNEFSGRVWVDYTDSDLQGDKLEGDQIPVGDYDETRYGLSFGGPIVEDTFFFFAAYEKADGADTFDRCAADQSCGRPVLGVTQAQLERIATIARDVYGYEPGETILSAPNEDEKFLLRLDWKINENHNAALTYNYNDGFNITQSDSDADEFEFSNHFYERGAELNAYSAQLFSDWTDNFSTELRIGYSELDNRQITQNDQGFGEVRIETYADADGDGSFDRANVYLGGDDSRQSNKLKYDTTSFKLAGTYTLGDHVMSGGYEREKVDIFNLFLQHTIGEYRFDESNTDLNGNDVGCNSSRPDGCIDQFEALKPDDIYYGNASPSLNPNDARAEFAYAVNTLYVQDEYTFADLDLTIVAGLRYDWYTSDDLPLENPNFIARTGFTNRKNFDDESLLQPRFGFNWEASDNLNVRGGFGLYSGGNPNVWLGNNYQNDGFSQVQAREGDGGVRDLNINPARFLGSPDVPLGLDGMGRPIFDAPQTMIQFVAGESGNSGVNAIAPGFDIPSNWKFSLGATWGFDAPGFLGNNYVLSGDVIYTQFENSVFIRDDTYVQISTAPDGRPVYYQADKSVPGCATDPLGTGPACDRLFDGDFILDNVKGDDGEQLSASITLSKAHDFGLDWTFGYAYTESDEVSPMTSSVAFSNYFNIAVADPNNPGLARSNYEIPHRFILRMSYEREFFGDLATRISMFGSANEGRPYSFTFSEQEMFVRGPFFFPDDDRSLLYMPDGPSDPNVVFDPDFDQDAFFAFAAANDLNRFGGGIVPRNSARSDWWTKFDIRISQELPGFMEDHRATAYLVIENIGNLLDDDWGVLNERSFPRSAPIVQASYLDTAGTPDDYSDDQYVFEEFFPGNQSRAASPSLWYIRFGFNYNF